MILIVQGELPHYRRALFNALAETEAVVVVHSGAPAKRDGDRFIEIITPSKKRGGFFIQPNLSRLITNARPKTVIAMFDLRWASIIRAMVAFDRHLNWIWWGPMRGQSTVALRIKLILARRDNPIIFYSQSSYDLFARSLASSDKLFIANNTLHIPDALRQAYAQDTKRNRLLNVGTLYARKQNDVTLHALARIVRDTDTDVGLTLIGTGTEEPHLRALATKLGIEDRAEFIGHSDDPESLAKHYATAIASVSFGQAGLAVLQSMAFGVPFVTKRNAISGGEIDNIKHGINGLLCDDDPKALEDALRQLITAPDYARTLGQAAYQHYSQHATLANMVANFNKARAYGEQNRG